ncbi:hypothetical protein CISIN_1g048593mg, partial [Citrus sinensis]
SSAIFVTRLLKGLINEKACKDQCYFLSVTNLKSIGRERGTVNESGVVFFPVTFLCRTFLPVKGEILHGVIHIAVCEQPFFSNEQQAKIRNGLVVQFLVTAVQWIDEGRNLKKKYLVFGRVEGESLGPVSLSGWAGTDDINLKMLVHIMQV